MASPIKKNAQDYARQDANNESGEDNRTYSFGLFRQDFSRKCGAVQEWHQCGSVRHFPRAAAFPFKPSRKSADVYGVFDRHAR